MCNEITKWGIKPIRDYEMGIAPLPLPASWSTPKRNYLHPVALFQACAERITLKQTLATSHPEKENRMQGELLKSLIPER